MLKLFRLNIRLCLLQEDVQEDWGWKLVAGEVFRPPKYPLLLAVMVGNGSQLCAMVSATLGKLNSPLMIPGFLIDHFLTIVFALLGFLSPSNRGSLATVMMIVWSFFGRFVIHSKKERSSLNNFCKQHWGLRIRPHICLSWWNQSQEECFPDCNCASHVGNLSWKICIPLILLPGSFLPSSSCLTSSS